MLTVPNPLLPPLHRRGRRVFHLEPVLQAAGVVGRVAKSPDLSRGFEVQGYSLESPDSPEPLPK